MTMFNSTDLTGFLLTPHGNDTLITHPELCTLALCDLTSHISTPFTQRQSSVRYHLRRLSYDPTRAWC